MWSLRYARRAGNKAAWKTRPARRSGALLLLAIVLGAVAPVPVGAGTHAPAIIPYGTGEGDGGSNGVGQTVGVIPNPMVGDYRWGWQESYPRGTPAGGWFPVRGLPATRVYYDSYKRFLWRAIERSRGQYDFSVIDAHLEQPGRPASGLVFAS